MLRSSLSPSPVTESMKDNPPETGRETDSTLMLAETGRDTTGTGARNGRDGTTEITAIIARTGIVPLFKNAPKETGILSVDGNETVIPLETAIVTEALITTTTANDPGRMWIAGGRDTITTARTLIVSAGGTKKVEIPGQ